MQKINPTPPFLKIDDASRVTGLSRFFLRRGCRDGSVPHVMSGAVYMVNIPALLRKLNADENGRPEMMGE